MTDTTHAIWRKSTRSGNGGNCVEVASNLEDSAGNAVVLVRDSKNPDASALTFSGGEWSAFVEGAKAGEFDL